MTANNMQIWDAVSKTDPAHTKQFSRAGGFKGTAIKPIWTVKRLTEQFGPVGKGWGMGEPSFNVVPADGELMVYCTVTCWHTDPSQTVVGVGGDKVTAKRKDGGSFNDDEAFKKAFTDAVGNAFKFLGFGADVHMGQFEDSKYVQETAQEYAKAAANDTKPKKLEGPYTSATALKKAVHEADRNIRGCGDSAELEAYLTTPEFVALSTQLKRDAVHYLKGGPELPDEFEPLYDLVKRMKRDFEDLENQGDNDVRHMMEG